MAKAMAKLVCEVAKGDCVKLIAAKAEGFADLTIADPPYNFGMPYEAYADNKKYDEYMDWTRNWLSAVVHRAMCRHGSLVVFAPDDWVSEIDMVCRHELELFKRRQIVWAFTFGQKAHHNFTRSHVHLLYYSKTKTKFTFNADAVKVPSARELVYNDRRAVKGGKPPDATWMLLREQMEPYMTPDKDTWLVSRICGTYKERQKHSPNQIPVPIMERLVLACSNPGDTVFDPFAGTCSSGIAAKMHGRGYVGFDISPTCVALGKKRLAAT